MKIAVCIKQVLETRTLFQIDEDAVAIKQQEPEPVYVVNPADRAALELAVRLRNSAGGGSVTVLTLGPDRAEDALRYCLAAGADAATHLNDSAFDGSDSFAVALALSRALKPEGYDLIICGDRALDDGAGQVGPIVAEILDLPQATGAVGIEMLAGQRWVKVERRLEKGNREVLECPLPAVVTVDALAVRPRYVSVHAYLRAAGRPIKCETAETLGLKPDEVGTAGSLVHLIKVAPPRPRPKKVFTPDSNLPAAQRMKMMMSGGVKEKKGDFLEGSPKEVASQIVKFLTDEKVI